MTTCDHGPWGGWEPECAENHVDDLAGALRFEAVCLWDDLDRAVRYAINGTWSSGCDGIADRIVTIARLVGAVPWDHIQVGLLQSGVYERVHNDAGIEFDPIDWEAVARTANACTSRDRTSPDDARS